MICKIFSIINSMIDLTSHFMETLVSLCTVEAICRANLQERFPLKTFEHQGTVRRKGSGIFKIKIIYPGTYNCYCDERDDLLEARLSKL